MIQTVSNLTAAIAWDGAGIVENVLTACELEQLADTLAKEAVDRFAGRSATRAADAIGNGDCAR